MSSEDSKTGKATEGIRTPITRRDFLKTAGVTGLALGATGGLGGVLAACGSSGDDSSGSGSSGAAAAPSRSASSARSPARSPPSARPTSGCVEQWKAATKDGVLCGDGKIHPVEIIIKDSQSDSNRAAHRRRRPRHQRRHRRHDGRLHAGHGEPRRRPGRGAADPLRLQRLPVAAVLLRPRRHARQALQVDLPRLLGPRGRHRRVHRHVGPAQDQQEGRRHVAERRRRPRLGRPQDGPAADAQGGRLHRRRRRPVPGRHRGLHAADQQVQVGRLPRSSAASSSRRTS